MQGTTRPNYRVLVAEDDRSISRLITGTLQRAGFTTQTAYDGLDAMQRLSAESYDLLILDISMPYMNGQEILRHVRNLQGSEDMSVVMVTSQATDQDIVSAYHAGADLYMTKPFDPVELVRSAFTLLRNRTIALQAS